MIPRAVAAAVVVPIHGRLKNVVQVLFAKEAKSILYFMLDCWDHSLHEGLQIR